MGNIINNIPFYGGLKECWPTVRCCNHRKFAQAKPRKPGITEYPRQKGGTDQNCDKSSPNERGTGCSKHEQTWQQIRRSTFHKYIPYMIIMMPYIFQPNIMRVQSSFGARRVTAWCSSRIRCCIIFRIPPGHLRWQRCKTQKQTCHMPNIALIEIDALPSYKMGGSFHGYSP